MHVDVFPESRAAKNPTPAPGCRPRCRATRHRAAGGVAERIQGLDDMSEVRAQLSSIGCLFNQARTSSKAASLCRNGGYGEARACQPGPRRGMLPRYRDRARMQIGTSGTHSLIDHVDDRLLDHPRPPAPGARRRQRGHLERAAAPHGGACAAVEDAGPRVSRTRLLQTTSDAVNSGLLRFSARGQPGGTIETPTSASASTTSCPW